MSGLPDEIAAGLDERLRGELDDVYEKLLGVIEAGLESKRKVRVVRDCPKCGCGHIDFVEIENIDAAIKAAEFYANRTAGRAAAGRPEGEGEGVSFLRKVVYGGEEVSDEGFE